MIEAGLAVLFLFSGCASILNQSLNETTAPRSNVSREKALILARAMATAVGGEVFSIAPTGSMRPTLDEGSLVTIERIAFSALKKGDIVVYLSADGHPVIHRVYQSARGSWLVLGDNNGSIDAEVVSPKNLIGRVCAIFYTSDGKEPDSASAMARR